MYFKNIFYHVTLKNVFRILNYSVYFQNIIVCNETLREVHDFTYAMEVVFRNEIVAV